MVFSSGDAAIVISWLEVHLGATGGGCGAASAGCTRDRYVGGLLVCAGFYALLQRSLGTGRHACVLPTHSLRMLRLGGLFVSDAPGSPLHSVARGHSLLSMCPR